MAGPNFAGPSPAKSSRVLPASAARRPSAARAEKHVARANADRIVRLRNGHAVHHGDSGAVRSPPRCRTVHRTHLHVGAGRPLPHPVYCGGSSAQLAHSRHGQGGKRAPHHDERSRLRLGSHVHVHLQDLPDLRLLAGTLRHLRLQRPPACVSLYRPDVSPATSFAAAKGSACLHGADLQGHQGFRSRLRTVPGIRRPGARAFFHGERPVHGRHRSQYARGHRGGLALPCARACQHGTGRPVVPAEARGFLRARRRRTRAAPAGFAACHVLRLPLHAEVRLRGCGHAILSICTSELGSGVVLLVHPSGWGRCPLTPSLTGEADASQTQSSSP